MEAGAAANTMSSMNNMSRFMPSGSYQISKVVILPENLLIDNDPPGRNIINGEGLF
jgi:hypothetical protein